MKHYTKRGKQQRKKTLKRKHGGERLAGHVNPKLYDEEYQMVMHMIDGAKGEQVGYPRFVKFKEIFAYLLKSEEVLKNKPFRNTIRGKINDFAEGHKNYIDKNVEYGDMVQQLLTKINDLDMRNVRHKVPN